MRKGAIVKIRCKTCLRSQSFVAVVNDDEGVSLLRPAYAEEPVPLYSRVNGKLGHTRVVNCKGADVELTLVKRVWICSCGETVSANAHNKRCARCGAAICEPASRGSIVLRGADAIAKPRKPKEVF